MYIEKINQPTDVKNLNSEQLHVLADEMRQALLQKLSKHGGHFGPNLGMVEATIALHYVFNSPTDKIVYDVSHQSYPHNRFAQPGEPMQEMTVIMELKLLADVGLVGFPNAGKSTLLASVSAAKPKIANYPFTTLEPNLGIVSYRDSKSFVMADIPGIIEGASAGKGLGLRFLRHIERNSLLLFMVPADSDDIRKEYEILLNELSTFNPEMLDKQRVLAITKSDMLDQELMDEIEPTLPANVPHVFISSITGMGLSVLKDILWEELNKDSNKIEAIVHRPKDVSKLQQELKDMGEDEDLSYEYVEDDEDVEDLEDFEYEEEDWEDDKQ